MNDLLQLIEQQRLDDRYARVPDRPLEFPAGLNPHALAARGRCYLLSGRKIKRRRKRSEVTHGTTAMYKRGCRCGECRGEQSRRNKAWRSSRQVAA